MGYNPGVPGFGENLEQLRAASGLSRKVLAALIGASEKQISFWVNGRAEPQPGNLAAAAKLFGVTPRQLRGEEPLPDPLPTLVLDLDPARQWPERSPQALAWRGIKEAVIQLDVAGISEVHRAAMRELDRVLAEERRDPGRSQRRPATAASRNPDKDK